MPFSSEKPKYKRLRETLNFLAVDTIFHTISRFTVARALTDVLSPVLLSHGSRSSAFRSDLLKVATVRVLHCACVVSFTLLDSFTGFTV